MRANAFSRRGFLAGVAGAGTLAALGAQPGARAAEDDANWKASGGNIRHSVVPWCFKPMSIETLAKAAADLGLKSVELLDPREFPTLQKYGLTCAILGSHGFAKGFNHVENHDFCIEKIRKSVDAAAAFGCPNVITFSGFKQGIAEDEGFNNTVNGLKKVIGYAEEKKITLCFEVLNSRVATEMKGHPDYQGDKLEWAVALCDKVGSPRMKILFDIYHIQIMEGDVIRRIQQYKDYIGHVHTAGVPGRNDLDDTQEINYPPIMRALVASGYKGFVGHEFIPRKEDKVASLRQGVRVCDV